jgi:hypothetical protein
MKNPCPYSWKKCTFAHVFLQHYFLLLNFSAELRPRKRFYEQNLTSVGGCALGADSSVGRKGLSQVWLRIWLGPALSLCL